jgi:hypothetical protein
MVSIGFARPLGLAVLFFGSISAQIHVAPEHDPQFAAIHIQSVDILGRSIRKGRVQLTSVGNRNGAVFESEAGDFARVPYGDYRVRALAPGFNTGERSITIDRPNMWVTMPLTVWSHFVSDEPVLSGKIVPPIVDGAVWAKLVGVYNNVILESAVSEQGLFHFEPKDPGVYIVLVIKSDRVLDTAQIELTGYKRIEMRSAAH